MSKILSKRILSVSMLAIAILFLPIKDNLVEAASLSGKVVNTSWLTVRTGPSVSSKTLGAVKGGQNLNIISTTNGWGKISFNNKTGYVSLKYVKTGSVPTQVVKGVNNIPTTTTNSTKMSVTATWLNVRQTANLNAKVIGTLKQNTVLDVKKYNSQWGQVTVNNQVGYISLAWVKNVNGTTQPVNTPATTVANNSTAVIKNVEVTTSALNVRAAASNTSKVVGLVHKGDKLSSLGKTGDWYKVTFKNVNAYVHSGYVKEVAASSTSKPTPTPTAPASQTTKTGYVTTSALNVRENGNNTSKIIGLLKKNDAINISSVTNNWAKFNYNGKDGYVSMTYITYTKPSTATNNNTSQNTNPSTNNVKYVVGIDNGYVLNVRKGPNATSSKIGSLTNGTQVKVLESLSGWYKIAYNGSYGYVSADFIGNSPDKTATKPINNINNSLAGKTIVVDPGHGGKDSGAIGNGLYEKNITLGTALYLRDELTARGAKVIMTRTGDTYPTLSDRVNISNRSGGDMFISIHINSASPAASGVESWYYDSPTTLGSKSKELAQDVQAELIKTSSIPNRGVQSNIFFVNKYNNLPSVLVELGFITSPYDSSLLSQDSFKRADAKALAEGITKFLN